MKPSQALDAHVALIQSLQTPVYYQHVKGYLTSVGWSFGAIKTVADEKRYKDGGLADRDATNFLRSMVSQAKVSLTYHVQRDMNQMVKFAAADLDGLDRVTHKILPSDHGVLFFDDGWVTQDVNGKDLVYSAIQWAVSTNGDRSGLQVYYYTDVNDPRDSVNTSLKEGDHANTAERYLRSLGQYHLTHSTLYDWDMRVGGSTIPTPEGYVGVSTPGEPKPSLMVETPNDLRVVVALFRLLKQTLVEVKDAPIERPSARRAKKARLPQRVQTICLRKREVKYLNPPEHVEGSVEWSHQWLVRGHHAWRVCGAEHPLAEPYKGGWGAYLYIQPYWKGPQDAPMVITEKVRSLVR